ncbi:HAD family phosphatase [Gardnerella vaginalis]|uniref:HAD family hydrolase n=1 Tax=Gardnerella vaginalis TaxID=2702 RepID=UPI000E310A0B|nr:HAD family phosphatase [Gardnerella vaginalis]NSX27582.1 HAD family phosphatase [Gardnerella vaginalis]RFD78883.1 HAD family hydrolase [Gardnerella vaginalis]
MSENVLVDNSNCAAIFDFDGTLLYSLHVWDDIDEKSFAKRGIKVPDDFADSTATMTPREVADYVIARFGFTDSPEDLMQEWNDMANEAYSNQLLLRKGAKNYVDYLHKTGAKLVLMTTLSKSLCEASLKRTELWQYFDLMIFGEDLQSDGKNSPQTYLDLSNRIGVKPEYCTVFEDSAIALKSARLAGMKTCGVADLDNSDLNPEFNNCFTVFCDFDFAPKVLCKKLSENQN